MKSSDEFSWKNIWDYWETLGYTYFSLTQDTAFEIVTIPVENCPRGVAVHGADWIKNGAYDERTDYVRNNPSSYLLLCPGKNKGIQKTAENLIFADGDYELTAGIWVYATTKDLLENLPEKWHGGAKKAIIGLNHSAFAFIQNKVRVKWNHAAWPLVPNIFFTPRFCSDFVPSCCKSILEAVAVNAQLITGSYRLVLYQTRDNGE